MTSLTFAEYSIDELEDTLISYASELNASEYRFLVALREFDLRQGWRAWQCTNCVSWMNFKCRLTPGTAREKLRVALALIDLPFVSEAFEKGEISYSNVRAMTRIAGMVNEEQLVDFAIGSTASQVEDYCRQIRNGQRVESSMDANRTHRTRWLSRSCRSDGAMTISVELCREMGELVMAAIDTAMASEAANCDESLFARQADALVEVARTFLADGTEEKKTQNKSLGDHYQVMVHVDEGVLKGQGGKSDLPMETARRLTCDGQIKEISEDATGTPINIGRKHRTVTASQKLGLLSRDQHCRFPGCTHERWLDAHHVKHWADGGATTLDNMILLCSTHHRALHEGGFEIKRDFKGDWSFRTPGGRPIVEGETGLENASREMCEKDHISEPAGIYVVGCDAGPPRRNAS